MNHPRSTFGASPSRGRYWWPGKAGSTVALVLAGWLVSVSAFAQQGNIASGAVQPASAASLQKNDDLVPGTAGIQGQNILEVKPEVKPDASSDPNYLKQSNGERNRVQPGNNAPMWRDVQRGMEGFTNYPKDKYPEMGVLIQPPVQYPGSRMTTAGEAWRQVRNDWIIPYGGALVLIACVALLIFWFGRGPIGHNPAVGGGGRLIERFTPFERAAHWTNAIAFSILGISGLVMAFGKFFILPVIGTTLYGPLTWILKSLHNFAGPVFAVSIVIIIITFIKDEFPQSGDLRWLLHLGGVFRKNHGDELPAHRFNAGEKVVFWIGVFVFGLIAVASGLVMDKLLPIEYDRATMQMAHMVHSTAAVLMVCVLSLHIYLGTIGYRGAYTTMRRGYVDEAWAKEHHSLWLEDVQAGRVPAQRSSQPPSPEATGDVRPA